MAHLFLPGGREGRLTSLNSSKHVKSTRARLQMALPLYPEHTQTFAPYTGYISRPGRKYLP